MTGQLDLFHQPLEPDIAPPSSVPSEDQRGDGRIGTGHGGAGEGHGAGRVKPRPHTQMSELAGTTWEHAFGCQIDESAGQDTP